MLRYGFGKTLSRKPPPLCAKILQCGRNLHSLRHTNATLQIANGVPLTTVAGNLGHADSATTTKIYAHAIQSAAAASAQMMDDLLNPMAGKRRP